MVKSGITQEELIGWGGIEVFNQAVAFCQSGSVLEASYDDDTLTISGKIAKSADWAMPVKFKLEPGGRIRSECPCETNQRYGQICPHVVALGFAVMISEMDDSAAETSAARRKLRKLAHRDQHHIQFSVKPHRLTSLLERTNNISLYYMYILPHFSHKVKHLY
jgi:hypothetical protein